jgi:hypothetical protein
MVVEDGGVKLGGVGLTRFGVELGLGAVVRAEGWVAGWRATGHDYLSIYLLI